MSWKVKRTKVDFNLSLCIFISVPVRLGGIGSSATDGFVEVFNTTDGQWGGVCHNSFDIIDAHIVCIMLGYPTAVGALVDGTAYNLYGTAPSGNNFVLDNLMCSGFEGSIFECPLTGESTESCEATQIAGVKCATSKL